MCNVFGGCLVACVMSRRKQSNPKPLKSELDSSEKAITETREMACSLQCAEVKSVADEERNSDLENLPSDLSQTDQSRGAVTSSKYQQRQRKEEEPIPGQGLSTCRSVSMAASDRKIVASPSVSFADLPKITSSGSYSHKDKAPSPSTGIPSPDDASTKAENSPSPESKSPPSVVLPKEMGFLQNSLLNASLAEASVIASNLLKASSVEVTASQLKTMIQGIPLLTSMLPALQRLAPALGPLPIGSGGILCVCGVKFSNSSNLEAHRMFYCSHRNVNSSGKVDRKEESRSPTQEENEGSTQEKLLKCPHCPYTTCHKLSLNGHMNMHTNPEDSSQHSSNSSSFAHSLDLKAPERYCSDCDIQFSSLKTFRVHKLHYCQTRHVLKGGSKSPAREEPSHISLQGLTSAVNANVQPVLALSTNPVLLLPYSLVAGAQLLPPHVLPQLGAAFVLPNGQVHPIPSATTQQINAGTSLPSLLSPGALAAAVLANTSSRISPSNISPTGKSDASYRSKSPRDEDRKRDRDSPLDLTTKRPKLSVKTDLLSDEEKENREFNHSSKSPLSKGSVSRGEFEGKLLSSPPRVSPSDSEELSGERISRPPSAVANMSSPRALQSESPRPSTSAISPVTSSSLGPIALPPGFPNHLINSLPLASLQYLQSLQGVPRELALKLISPDLLMNGLSSVLNPLSSPVIVKQGEAKCNECNIVFYKEESLQIHKKHYCSARDSKKTPDEEGRRASDHSPSPEEDPSMAIPLRSPVKDTSPTTNQLSPKETSKQAKPLLQFICTACGIKFSSPDNLAAHQTYYCPKRDDPAEDGPVKGIWRCPRCRVVMGETMQAAHQCVTPAPAAPSHGWKCPCCPVLSPTAAAAQKHLETHAGIKAFRCTICGYRGNTLRGMRTHIRMHFEKRTNDLQEENFIACILEDDDLRGVGRTSSSSECRKLIDSTRLFLETSALSSLLVGEGTGVDQVDTPFACSYCPFMTSVRSTLLQHLTIVHSLGLNQELKNILDDTKGPPEENHKREVDNDCGSPPILPSVKLEPEVTLEVQDSSDHLLPKSPAISVSATATSISNGSPPLSNGQCYCHTCNIGFSLLDSYLAHKKFYCSRPESSTPPETTVQ